MSAKKHNFKREHEPLQVQKYLRENTQRLGEKGVTVSLQTEHHVRVKRSKINPELYSFKYQNFGCDFTNPITCECRGLILSAEHNWDIVSFPFRKFFNYKEPLAHDIDWQSAKVYEKLDGSIATLYYYKNKWHVASSGTVDGDGDVIGYNAYNKRGNFVFRQLFWDIWKRMDYKKPRNTNRCYMFEMISVQNVIVVRPKKDELVFLGARDLTTLEELDPLEVASECGWKAPTVFDINDPEALSIASQKLNPVESEGFVVCDRNFQRVKIKSPQYVALTHLNPRDKYGKNAQHLLQIVRTNEGDEFLTYFPKYKQEYMKMRAKFLNLVEDWEKRYKRVIDNCENELGIESPSLDEMKPFLIKELSNFKGNKKLFKSVILKLHKKEIMSIKQYLADCDIFLLMGNKKK